MQFPVRLFVRLPVLLELLRLCFVRLLLRLGLLLRCFLSQLFLLLGVFRGLLLILSHTHPLPASRRGKGSP